MKVLISILLFLAGVGAIAYSYVASLFALASDVERTAQTGDDASAFAMVVDFVLSGEIPQATSYLYFGLLLVALSVVNLVRRRSRKEDHDEFDAAND